MAILNITSYPPGLVGVNPSIVYIDTNDTLATVLTAGYLNKSVQQGYTFTDSMMACVSIKSSPSATSTQVAWLEISHSGSNWSLSAPTSSIILQSGYIFVGNAGGVATAVPMTGDIGISNTGLTAIQSGVIVNADINASAGIAFSKLAALTSSQILVGSAGNVVTAVALSGDATISNTGALTIANNAITTVKIADANVTLGKLASGITPSSVIKFGGQLTTVGGAAAEAFTVTGAVGATDRAFVQMVDDGTNNVTVLQAVVTDNTLTITFSGNPGNDAVFNYMLIRAAA